MAAGAQAPLGERGSWCTYICLCARQRLVAQRVVGVGPDVLCLERLRDERDVHSAHALACRAEMSLSPYPAQKYHR